MSLVCIGVLAVGVSAAVAKVASTGSGKAAAPFVVNYAVPPATIDPGQVCSLEDNGFVSSLYVTLVQYKAKPVPGAGAGITQEDTTGFAPYLAKSWKITNGGKTYTFTLRSGAKFPDGKPMDANAVKYTYQRLLTMGGCGAYFMSAGQGDPIIKAIQAPNPTTLVIQLTRPEALLLHTLTQPNLGIVEPSLVEANGGVQKGKPNQWLASHYAGGGPYVLESYDPSRQAVFAANPSFFGSKPLESKVIVNFITSDPTLLLQARSGNANITVGLTKKSVASLRSQSCCRVVSVSAPLWQLIGLPNEFPPFDNVKFREALTYAVPYQQILSKVAYGFGKIYYGPLPPAFTTFRAALEKPRAFDLAKAKELIGASGVKLPVNAEMVIREGVNDQEQIATIVQGVWKTLGVNLTIRKLAAGPYANAIYADTKKYTLVRFDGPSVTDPEWLLEYDTRCNSMFNTSDYCNPTADALLNKTHSILDPAKRQAIWDQVTKMWVAASPRIPVYEDDYTIVLKKGVNHYYYAQDGFTLNKWGR